MTPQELAVVKSVLVASKAIDASASDAEVQAAHAAALSGPSATEYRATLASQGVQAGMSWMTIIGIVGGAVAIYFIWKHYQEEKVVDSRDYPEPQDTRHRIRNMGRALGALRMSTGRGRLAGCSGPKRMGRFGAREEYEFEPERRLEGYRRKARRK